MKLRAVALASTLAAVVASGNSIPAESADRDPYCSMFLETQQEMRGNQGERINPLTAFSGVDVRCSEKVVDFRQAVLAPGGKLRGGWQDRLQVRWSSAYCRPGSKSLEAVRNGWTIATTVTTGDGTQVRVTADCRLAVATLYPPRTTRSLLERG